MFRRQRRLSVMERFRLYDIHEAAVALNLLGAKFYPYDVKQKI